jgi:hypothetical protein
MPLDPFQRIDKRDRIEDENPDLTRAIAKADSARTRAALVGVVKAEARALAARNGEPYSVAGGRVWDRVYRETRATDSPQRRGCGRH